jgi:S1-C subfamily serine protease
MRKMTRIAAVLTAAAALSAPPVLAQRGAPPNRTLGDMILTQGPGSQIGMSVSDVEVTSASGTTRGAVVIDVRPDSPASAAGLRAKDIVVEFDGEAVRSARQLARLVQETPPGRQVAATVIRAGQRQQISVTPTEGAGPRVFMPDGQAARTFELDRAQLEERLRTLREQIERMPIPGAPGAPRLGVTVQELTPELAAYFGAKEGALVSSVADDSPGARAGLRVGDVITAAGGQPVRSSADLSRAVRTATGSVALAVVRDKQTLTITVTLDRPTPRGPRAGQPI